MKIHTAKARQLNLLKLKYDIYYNIHYYNIHYSKQFSFNKLLALFHSGLSLICPNSVPITFWGNTMLDDLTRKE